MIWSWIPSNLGLIWHLTWENAYIGVVSALIGLVVSVPLGIACVRLGWLYPPLLSLTSAVYAIPSLAIFVVLIAYTGLTAETVIIALTLFSLCVLLPNVVDGLRSVPSPVRQAATAMGFGPLRRLVRVELPISIPVIMAGLRVAMVSSISLASLGQLIGVSTLGYLFIDGLQRDFPTEIWLALVMDLLLVGVQRLLTPWRRAERRERGVRGRGASAGDGAGDAAQAVAAAAGAA
jgi:osmoprotectant transport system permease protein